MFANTGIPSTGHPVPVNGLHWGEENGRNPTKFRVVPPAAPVTVEPLGIWNTEPAGTVTVYWLSSRNWPQLAGESNEETALGFALAMLMMSRQVCGLAKLRSRDASNR